MHRRRIGVALAGTALTVACSGPAHPASSAAAPTDARAARPGPAATTANTPRPSPPAVEPCEEAVLARLGPAARVGQLLMIGVPAGDPASAARTVRQHLVGGVFLAGRSSSGVSATRAGVDRLRRQAAPAVPLTVAVDQEGGYVQTLRGPGFSRIPTALSQGGKPAAQLRRDTTAWARELRAAGVTLDLAPVADTVAPGFGAANPPIGRFEREYGRTPDAVTDRMRIVVPALRAAGVGATVKHFPGLGRVRANPDDSTAAVDRVTSRTDPNLGPFRAGIAAGAAAVMVSSARYPRLDPANVAVFSPAVITGLLRRAWGYDRLVVSDDLGRAAAVQQVPLPRRAVAFVAAGGDVVLDVRTEDAGVVAAALLARYRSDAGFRHRVDDAVGHVLASKKRSGLLTCPRPGPR